MYSPNPKKTLRVALAACLAIAGCGGTTKLESGAPPPHGGSLIALPEGKGSVEVVRKSAGADASKMTSELAFYLLDPKNAPITPAPASGTLTVGKKVVNLKSEGDGLVTPEGPALFPRNAGLDGVLSVDLGGKPVTVPLGLR